MFLTFPNIMFKTLQPPTPRNRKSSKVCSFQGGSSPRVVRHFFYICRNIDELMEMRLDIKIKSCHM